MLKIRLTRMGAKKNPFYRIIVIDSKEARNGAPTDTIGWYDPAKLDAPVKIDEEKTLSWLGKGAQPTDTVRSILRKNGILAKFAEGGRTMKELVETLVKALVKNPDAVSVTVVEKGSLEIYQVHVAPEDMGKVIGRKGRIANAIRTVVKAGALRENRRVAVDII